MSVTVDRRLLIYQFRNVVSAIFPWHLFWHWHKKMTVSLLMLLIKVRLASEFFHLLFSAFPYLISLFLVLLF